MYLCVLCGSENKQRLFPYTALTAFYNLDCMCLFLFSFVFAAELYKVLAIHILALRKHLAISSVLITKQLFF